MWEVSLYCRFCWGGRFGMKYLTIQNIPWIFGFCLILSIPTKIAAKGLEAKYSNFVRCLIVNILIIISYNIISVFFKENNYKYLNPENSLTNLSFYLVPSCLIIANILKTSYRRAACIAFFPFACILGIAFLTFIIAGISAIIMMIFKHPDFLSTYWRILTTPQQ
jgi:hypothetical protein